MMKGNFPVVKRNTKGVNAVVIAKDYKHPNSLGNGQLAHESLAASVVSVAAVFFLLQMHHSCHKWQAAAQFSRIVLYPQPGCTDLVLWKFDFSGYLIII